MMKTVTKVVDAAAMISEGSVLHIGGFMGVGAPHRLIAALVKRGVGGFTVVANDCGRPDDGIGKLVAAGRAAGVGLGGVLTATGLGTEVEKGKQTIEVEGKRYLVEPPIRADFALIAAKSADYKGNLEYQLTAHNFNPVMALAADVVIAEARWTPKK